MLARSSELSPRSVSNCCLGGSQNGTNVESANERFGMAASCCFQTIVESGEGGGVAVPVFGIGELKARTKNVIRLVAQIRAHEVRDAAEHETAGDQQRRRGGDFQRDQGPRERGARPDGRCCCGPRFAGYLRDAQGARRSSAAMRQPRRSRGQCRQSRAEPCHPSRGRILRPARAGRAGPRSAGRERAA